MNAELFKKYLELNGYPESTIKNRTSNCRNIENHYGDLDILYSKDKFENLFKELIYTTDDERENAPARHKIPIDGNIRNGSSTLKHALNLYKEFKENEYYLEGISEEKAISFKYEKDLEKAILAQINSLFPEYDLISKQHRIEALKMDFLLAHKVDKHFLVVEIKSSEVGREAFGQISDYITLLQMKYPDNEIKGCLIGSSFADNMEQIVASSKYEIFLKRYKLKIELE